MVGILSRFLLGQARPIFRGKLAVSIPWKSNRLLKKMVPWGPGMIKIPKPLQQVKTRWHSSYVLDDMGPLLTYLLTAVPSILTLRYWSFIN